MSEPAPEFLAEELSEERVAAILEAGGIDLDAVLTSLLWDGRTWMRRNAGLALKLAGKVVHEKLEALPVAAKDSDAPVRACVVAALATIGLEPEKATPPLLRSLTDSAEEVRENALSSLARLILDHPDVMVRLLIEAISDPRPIVELTVRDLLLQAGEPAVVPLVEALGHDNANVRYGVFAVLEQLGAAATDALVPALLDPRRRPRVIRLLEKAPAPTDAQRESLSAVAGQDDAEAAQAALRILAATGRASAASFGPIVFPHNDFADRFLTADELKGAAINGAKADGFVRALSDGRPEVRANSARLMAVAGDALSVVPVLVPLVRDTHVQVIRVAVELLAELGGEAAVAPLVAAAAHSDPTVASTAWKALLVLGRDLPEALIVASEGARADASQAAVLAALSGGGKAAVAALAKALAASSRPPTRRLCAVALGRIGAEATAGSSALISALSDADSEVRAAAAVALGELGDAGTATLSALQGAQADSVLAVRRAASIAIARLTGEPYLDNTPPRDAREMPIQGFADDLLDRLVIEKHQKDLDADQLAELLSDGRPVVRANAARALAVLGGRAAGALRPLLVVLKDSNPEVRLAAVEAFAALGPAAADAGAAALVSRLGDRHPDVVAATGEALRAMGDDALPAMIEGLGGTARFVSLRLVPALSLHGAGAAEALAGALALPSPRVRTRALESLVALGRPLATGVRAAVEPALDDASNEVRNAARNTLDFIDGKESAATARESGPLPLDGFDRQPLEAADFAKAKPPIESEWLIAALRDGRSMVRRNAAAALGSLGQGREAVAGLALSLKDGAPEVRLAAAESLGHLGAKDAAAALSLVTALSDNVPRVAQAARDAFESLGKRGIPALIAALDSGRAATVDAALAALATQGKDALPALVELLNEGSVAARFQALRGLDALGTELAASARPEIEAALTHPSRDVRVGARSLIDRLDGRGAGPAVYEAALMPVEGFDVGPLDADLLKKSAKNLDADWLYRALRDGRPAVRLNAARALPLCASGAEPRDALVMALKDGRAEVRIAAAESLGALGAKDDAAVAALVPAIFDSAPEVGRVAREALESLGDGAVNGLVRALGSQQSQAILGALELLRTRGAVAAAALASALGDSSEIMRLNAVRGLGLLGAEAGAPVADQLGAVAESDTSARVRRAATAARARVTTLGPSALTREPEAYGVEGFESGLLDLAVLTKAAKSLDLDRLVRALSDGRAVVRANAALGLSVLGKSAHSAVRAIAVLMRDGEATVRQAAATALGALAHDPEVAVPALTRALRQGPDSLRPILLGAIDGFGKASVPPLLLLLDDAEDTVMATVGRVCQHAPKLLVEPLTQAVAGSTSPRARENAIELLASLGSAAAEAESVLLTAMADTDTSLRCKAIRALGRTAKPSKALLASLEELGRRDDSMFVQSALETALGELRRRG
ncbi:MAG: HEAT repeat domain-containing protein [Myxococcota bacterium]